jgi:uncharacterized membrane protein
MKTLTSSVARWVFAVPFIIFGLSHLLRPQALAPMVPVPGGVFWVYVTGIALIAGGLGIGTKVLGHWAGLGLAALMLTFVVTIHVPGLLHPGTRQMALIMMLKDLALGGGALTWAGVLSPAREKGRPPARPSAIESHA